jgi:histidinol dehydrogenase
MKPIEWNSLSEAEREATLRRPALETREDQRRRVAEILREVREQGDAALFRLTERLDGVKLESLELGESERQALLSRVEPEAWSALRRAADQIARFHEACLPRAVELEVSPGLRCRREARPIERVGLYIPGGTAPLPSTVLMLGIPARLAGAKLRVLCTPPRKDGTIAPCIVAAAELCGITRIFRLGGAQAVAALAYGSRSVPKVDKIFGPGNSWVTEAKAQVASDALGAAIDMPAGPSEVLVVADAQADAELVAADLLSQAEHGPDSQVVLVSPSRELLEAAAREVLAQLETLSRKDIAEVSLRSARFILVSDLEAALSVSNRYAPEHLILQVEDADLWRREVISAGSVFLGPWSPEAVGDYASGTNHVLPTYGYARAFSGVSVDSFLKQITFQRLSADALAEIGPVVERLATLEGLDAHREAVTRRLKRLRGGLA